MIRTIKANYIDVIKRQSYVANISFSDKILSIEKVNDNIDSSLDFCVPGLIDSHVHIESSMLVPQGFARMVIPHGTVAAVCDPHEIANVLGEEGVRFMMRDAAKSPFRFFFAIPSCVPATPFETNGATFGPDEIARLMPDGVALAEMMNYPGLLAHDSKVMAEMKIAHDAGKPVDGHIPGITDDRLKRYVAEGVSTDHESFTLEEARAKLDLGMKILIREGSAARNLDALMPLFHTDPDKIMSCTDDAHPDDIRNRGHIDKFFRRALADGADVYDIFQVLSLNPIDHYKLDVGRLQVGDRADFVVLSDFNKFTVRSSFIGGEKVYDAEQGVVFHPSRSERPNNFISRSFSDDDFKVVAPHDNPTLRVIGLIPDQIVSEAQEWSPAVGQGSEVLSDEGRDIMKIAVINRYTNIPVVNGFISGTGLKCGAMASSIAHDSHNVVVIGRDAHSMRLAAEAMFCIKGGIVVISADGDVNRLQLPVAGLMTSDDWNDVADNYQRLIRTVRMKNGVTLKSPFMTMAFMCLLVIPSLKIGDRGLFDVDNFQLTTLFK